MDGADSLRTSGPWIPQLELAKSDKEKYNGQRVCHLPNQCYNNQPDGSPYICILALVDRALVRNCAQSIPSVAMTAPTPLTTTVAVIGAGAAGLCAALELRREGLQVVVYESEDQIGGTWVYTPESETDPMGIDPSRKVVHSSLYASLRTNLPREAMGYRVYPFLASGEPGRDSRRYPHHAEVLAYLRDFSREFGLGDLVRFGREVWNVELVEENGKWLVESRNRNGDGDGDREVYEAVVVCNGHYTEPRIAEIPGINSWPGKQFHSHNYREPDPFRDQIVVLIGGAASSADISREIAKVAKEVHIASRSVKIDPGKLLEHSNIWSHPMIKSVHHDGTVVFHDQTEVCADAIIHCTGYKYHFPFLKTNNGIVTIEDNRVGPLYKHVFPPALAPGLSFVGLPWKVAPFPLFEFQSKWIAGVLSGRVPLPSIEDMMNDVESFYSSLEASRIPKRYTHNLEEEQFEYNNWLASQSGCPLAEEWRRKMYYGNRERMRRSTETYRDQWEDDDLISQAHEDFKQLVTSS